MNWFKRKPNPKVLLRHHDGEIEITSRTQVVYGRLFWMSTYHPHELCPDGRVRGFKSWVIAWEPLDDEARRFLVSPSGARTT